MNSRIKKLLCAVQTVCIVAAICQTAALAEYEQAGESNIRLYGKTSCEQGKNIVSIDVYAHGKYVDDLRAETERMKYTDILLYREEVMSDETGKYDTTFSMGNSPSGIYDVYTRCSCGEDKVKEEIVYSNPAENKQAIEDLNSIVHDDSTSDAAKINKVSEICNNNRYALGFDMGDVDAVSAGIILNELKNKTLTEEDKVYLIGVYQKANIISSVSNGGVDNVFKYSKILGIDSGELKDFYNKDFVNETFGKYMTSMLKNESVSDFASFNEALTKQFILTAVRYPDGYANLQNVVNTFNAVIGLNRTISQSEALKVQNKVFSSYSALVQAINQQESISSGGTGGGTGGGSGSVGINGGKSTGSISMSGSISETTDKINRYIFDDIENISWAIEPIVELAQMGIINGKGDRVFCPNDNITREEFVKIISYAFLKDAENTSVSFSDVAKDAWYAESISKAYNSKIIGGIGDNLFGVGRNITREDMAVIAYRTAVYGGILEETETAADYEFEDDSDISDYAKQAVYALVQAEIVSGMGNDMFMPKQLLTRAQAAKIIYAIYSL